MNPTLLNKIIKAVNHAKEKHPKFCDNIYHGVSLATEELGELAQAVNDYDEEKIEAEALDTIAVLVRLLDELYRQPQYWDKEDAQDLFHQPVICNEMYVNGEKVK